MRYWVMTSHIDGIRKLDLLEWVSTFCIIIVYFKKLDFPTTIMILWHYENFLYWQSKNSSLIFIASSSPNRQKNLDHVSPFDSFHIIICVIFQYFTWKTLKYFDLQCVYLDRKIITAELLFLILFWLDQWSFLFREKSRTCFRQKKVQTCRK